MNAIASGFSYLFGRPISTVLIGFLALTGLINHSTWKSFKVEDHIRSNGYPVEAHEITTADGYILTYHRIPHGKAPPDPDVSRKPVLLQHGLLGSSATWVITTEALGYLIADAGFDLWLGNARGNTYSRRHTKYDPDRDKQAFWSFSWHEMGYYDLPASIDYILNVTKQRELFYIGHSMGTTMFFVLGATRPEYMAKVQAAVLMAPVAYCYNIRSPVANFVNHIQPFLDMVLTSLDIYEVLPSTKDTYWLDENVCSNRFLQFICRDVVFEITGFDTSELNRTTLSTAFTYLPAGSSIKQLQHFSQISRKGANFRQFDYGYVGNLRRYNSPLPPAYNLTNVNIPLYIHYAENDWLAVPQDVNYTVQRLPNVQGWRKVPFLLFNHLDFIWATDGKELVYSNIIETLKSLAPS